MTLLVMWVIFIFSVLACISLVGDIIRSNGWNTVVSIFALFVQVVLTVVLYHIVIHGGFNL
ncbi:hypothetical protein ANDROMEDA_52 [Bacillus phage Andromeda]|uniref:Uncharacterized protein n=3 Tax=Andromedavirus TaxID=1623275 RepID=M1I9L9_9CAUD|nr:hypothetical protein I905_gp52 [Bacillus phage Andromeda]AGE60891.1 hypothetical protein GEMINI_52 [Bacillus phage Gemini]AGE61122.1 hypothetical protein ANDROMEDA_52 [Bacillus phage Andromeda]QMS41921.1 putative lipoprotein signal peptide [Bacillus phage Bolokhovo]